MVLAVVVYLLVLGGSLFGILWGLVSIQAGFGRYAEWNALRDVPAPSLDAFAYGPMTIEGRIEPLEDTIRTPIGADDCVLFDIRVQDDATATSETRFDERQARPFAIVTDAGQVRVDPAIDLDVSAERTVAEKVESHEGRPPEILAFDRANGIERRGVGCDRRYEQEHVAPGDRVVAHGRAVRDEAFTEPAKPAVLVDGEGPFFLADTSRAELLSARRWALVRSVVLGVLAATASLTVFLWFSGIAQLFLGA